MLNISMVQAYRVTNLIPLDLGTHRSGRTWKCSWTLRANLQHPPRPWPFTLSGQLPQGVINDWQPSFRNSPGSIFVILLGFAGRKATRWNAMDSPWWTFLPCSEHLTNCHHDCWDPRWLFRLTLRELQPKGFDSTTRQVHLWDHCPAQQWPTTFRSNVTFLRMMKFSYMTFSCTKRDWLPTSWQMARDLQQTNSHNSSPQRVPQNNMYKKEHRWSLTKLDKVKYNKPWEATIPGRHWRQLHPSQDAFSPGDRRRATAIHCPQPRQSMEPKSTTLNRRKRHPCCDLPLCSLTPICFDLTPSPSKMKQVNLCHNYSLPKLKLTCMGMRSALCRWSSTFWRHQSLSVNKAWHCWSLTSKPEDQVWGFTVFDLSRLAWWAESKYRPCSERSQIPGPGHSPQLESSHAA